MGQTLQSCLMGKVSPIQQMFKIIAIMRKALSNIIILSLMTRKGSIQQGTPQRHSLGKNLRTSFLQAPHYYVISL